MCVCVCVCVNSQIFMDENENGGECFAKIIAKKKIDKLTE